MVAALQVVRLLMALQGRQSISEKSTVLTSTL